MPLSQRFLKKLKTSSFSISNYRSTAQHWRASSVADDEEGLEALMMSAMDYMCARTHIAVSEITYMMAAPQNICQLGLKSSNLGWQCSMLCDQ